MALRGQRGAAESKLTPQSFAAGMGLATLFLASKALRQSVRLVSQRQPRGAPHSAPTHAPQTEAQRSGIFPLRCGLGRWAAELARWLRSVICTRKERQRGAGEAAGSSHRRRACYPQVRVGLLVGGRRSLCPRPVHPSLLLESWPARRGVISGISNEVVSPMDEPC